MDANRFDSIARLLVARKSRRRALGSVLAAALAISTWRPDHAFARKSGRCNPACPECQNCLLGRCKKRKGTKKCKRGKCQPAADGVPCGSGEHARTEPVPALVARPSAIRFAAEPIRCVRARHVFPRWAGRMRRRLRSDVYRHCSGAQPGHLRLLHGRRSGVFQYHVQHRRRSHLLLGYSVRPSSPQRAVARRERTARRAISEPTASSARALMDDEARSLAPWLAIMNSRNFCGSSGKARPEKSGSPRRRCG